MSSKRKLETVEDENELTDMQETLANSAAKKLQGSPPSTRPAYLLVLLRCPICMDTLRDPQLTKCGHSFCNECIQLAFESSCASCPCCKASLSGALDVFPNPLLNSILEQQEQLTNFVGSHGSGASIAVSSNNAISANFAQPSQTISSQDSLVAEELLSFFLKEAKNKKETVMAGLKVQMDLLRGDLLKVESRQQMRSSLLHSSQMLDHLVIRDPTQEVKSTHSTSTRLLKSIQGQCERLQNHMADLETAYYASKEKNDDPCYFSEELAVTSRYSKFKTVAVLDYADNFFNRASSIVSSIKFDKDDDFFATAGVTKKIRIFQYSDVVRDYRQWRDGFVTARNLIPFELTESGDGDDTVMPTEDGVVTIDSESENQEGRDHVPRYPILEMSCNSKISCLSYNPAFKSYLASTDYEGCVSLWDASTGTRIIRYEEHEKRAWSVDFCNTEPSRLASGGDDSKVKIWSTMDTKSMMTIDTKANVCSVKFHPTLSYHIAFGTADHHIHYYDLRNLRAPVHIFKGHKKAASYVDFSSPTELVSASTDCTLKLWGINESIVSQNSQCVRTYQGHMNEKNFVGLGVNSTGDFIACGSETNEVFVYHSKLSGPIIRHKFGNNLHAMTGEEIKEDDPAKFVSSVCWKRSDPRILLAANSQGRVKVLELV